MMSVAYRLKPKGDAMANKGGRPMIKVRLGDRWGKLVCIAAGISRGGRPRRYVRCRCDCGVERDIPLAGLRRGSRTSCGCSPRVRVAPVVPPLPEPEIVVEPTPWEDGIAKRSRKVRDTAEAASWEDVEACGEILEEYDPTIGAAVSIRGVPIVWKKPKVSKMTFDGFIVQTAKAKGER